MAVDPLNYKQYEREYAPDPTWRGGREYVLEGEGLKTRVIAPDKWDIVTGRHEGFSGGGELESYKQRSALGASGTPIRSEYSYWDDSRGLQVEAPIGKHFQLFAGGGVKLVDGLIADEAYKQQDATKQASSLFDQATMGVPGGAEGEIMDVPGFKQEQMGYEPISGKEIASVGRSVFNPTTGVDEYADDGEVLIRYTDGTVERRKFGAGPGDSVSVGEFGRTAQELGITRQTEIKAEDGSIARAPMSAAEEMAQQGGPDNSGLEYIGSEYTSADGQKRVAASGNAFYQDPSSRTIVERPDTGAKNALPTTSPSILASRNDIAGMFRAVFGREASDQELKYWQGRTDKKGAALVGAMQFAKNNGQTVGDAQNNGSSADPIASIDADLNSSQDADFAALTAATSKVDLSKSAQLLDNLTKMLNERPAVPSLRDEYQKELLRSGYNEDAADLAEAERAVKQLDADFMSQLQQEETRSVSMTQIRRRQSAEQIAYDRIRRDLVVERDYLANKVAGKQAVVNTMMNFLGQDIANAQAEYQNRFQNAITMTNLIRQVEQDQLTIMQRQQDSARANVQIMSGLIASGNVKYSQLDGATKQQLKAMEMQAGLPMGFTQFVGETVKDPEVQFLPAYTDINGNRIQPVATVDPSTGAYKIKNISQGKVDLPVGSKSGGGSGAKAPTQDQLLVAAKSIVNSELASAAGSDGRVDPNTWNRVRQEWAATSPYSAKDFDAAFGGYVNNTYKGWEQNYSFSE